jgi:hypothetical protein
VYPFSTKLHLSTEENIWNFPDIVTAAAIMVEAAPAHSRDTSHSTALASEYAEEYAPPQFSDSPSIPSFDLPLPELIKLPTCQWQCLQCRKIFRRRDRGQAHLNVHINTRPYRCDGSCGDLTWLAHSTRQPHQQALIFTIANVPISHRKAFRAMQNT